MVVKTFRGLLAHGGQDRIRLSTIKGKVGYKIIKFQIITKNPTSVAAEAVYKITKKSLSTITAAVDFTNNDLLAVGFYTANTSPTAPANEHIIFDNEIFNQDIFISYTDNYGSTEPGNYYIELEVIPLASDEAAITTVKAMRGLAVD